MTASLFERPIMPRYQDPDLAAAIGALMRLWRWTAAMTLEQVAVATGSHRPVIGRLESGRHTPSIESLMRYAKATGDDVLGVFALVDAWYGFKPRKS